MHFILTTYNFPKKAVYPADFINNTILYKVSQFSYYCYGYNWKFHFCLA